MGLIDLLCAFDLTPHAAAAVRYVAEGGDTFGFSVPEDAGWSRPMIARLLTRHGVRAWGFQFCGDHVIFTTAGADARRAFDVLRQSGVPMLNADPRRCK